MTKAITKEMERQMDRAVEWLRDRGGSGVLDKFGRVLARGDSAITVEGVTWLRCVFRGRLLVEAGRIYLPEMEPAKASEARKTLTLFSAQD